MWTITYKAKDGVLQQSQGNNLDSLQQMIKGLLHEWKTIVSINWIHPHCDEPGSFVH